MTMRNAFEGLSVEDTQIAILMALNAIMDRLPRVDTNDRNCVRLEIIDGGLTLSTVTTVGNMTQIGGRDASGVSDALRIAGAYHIYNNIVSD